MGSIEGSSQVEIPTIDFAIWNSPSSTPSQRQTVANQLVEACHTVGFVSIINHGLSPSLLEQTFEFSRKLFDLKHEEKMLAPHPDGPSVHRGYSWPGLEKVSQVVSDDAKVGEELRAVADCKESYEVGSEDNADQPNIWIPEPILPGFQVFMQDFYWECNKIAKEILKAIGTGLELKEPEYLLKFHSGHNNQLRLLHYPPIHAAELENGTSTRMPAHSDWGSITFLFQDDCGGLELETQHVPEEFVKVTPVQNALVMNIGDLLMRWSNDYLKSTLHRVTLPPIRDRFSGPERITRARYSIPYFVAPDTVSIIECMSECTSADNPAKYKPVAQKDYMQMRAKLQYREKSE